jgi:hypothetical protein
MEARGKERRTTMSKRPTGAGPYVPVETSISCLITRFQLRSPWWLIPFYLAYRRVRIEAATIKGLLKTAFLIEGPRSCCILSIWAGDSAFIEFGTKVQSHVNAANAAFPATWRRHADRPGIWSAQFRLCAVSPYNLNWDGLDLRPLIDEAQWAKRDEIARVLRGVNDAAL